MRKYVILLLLSMLIFIPKLSVSAESDPLLVTLDTIANEALELTKAERYEEAERVLHYFEEEFSNVAIGNPSFTMDEYMVVTTVYNQAMEAIISSDMIEVERINKLTSFRLAVDSLTSEHQPLWTAMEAPLMAAVHSMKDATTVNNLSSYHENTNVLLEKYAIILPSLQLDVHVDKMQELDAKIMYLDRNRVNLFDTEEAMKELVALEKELDQIFQNTSEDEADPSLLLVMISTGSIIILSLSYVGIKKYLGQKVKKERKKSL